MRLWIVAFLVAGSARAVLAETFFIRGDVKYESGVSDPISITDAIVSLSYQFLGEPQTLDCLDAADVDDNGAIEITDSIRLLDFLFLGGPSPPVPYPGCGSDPTADLLCCDDYPPCPQGPLIPPPSIDPYPGLTGSQRFTVSGRVARESCGPAARPSWVEVSLGGRVSIGATAQGGRFQVAVDLAQNRINRLFVTAVFEGLRSSPVPVVVTEDETQPSVFIDFPGEGATLTSDTVTVAGRVADMLSASRGLVVTVNGQPANVYIGGGTNGTYEATIPLAGGQNPISVEARDALGNTSLPRRVVVTRVIPTGPQLAVVSGILQSTGVRSWLPAAMVVRLSEPNGSPIVGATVTFRVKRSDGVLAAVREGATARLLQATTGPGGEARAFLRLGTEAGCGNNRVEVKTERAEGSVFFCASATPAEAVQINVGSGSNQRAEVGGPAPEPFRALVSDGCNGVAFVPVTFKVIRGRGLVDGGPSATVETTASGHAEVSFQLGPEPGNNVVEASFPGNQTLPATFVVYGIARSPGQTTSFSGLVLDNAMQPIEGATCILEVAGHEGLLEETDRNGQFRFSEAASGPASLYVDGAAAAHVGGELGRSVPPGSFPALGYELVLVPDAENSLPTPVLLPPLNPTNARPYDGTRDVELSVEGMEGLKMLVKAGSVRRRDGSNPTPANPLTLSLNQVHFDEIPMPMPDGVKPHFAWTLQPAGTTFDPPASIQIPNIAGDEPGTIGTFLSFDHDTNRFEVVATCQVTEDGSLAVSDPGHGITKAGWGGRPTPPPPTGGSSSPWPPGSSPGPGPPPPPPGSGANDDDFDDDGSSNNQDDDDDNDGIPDDRDPDDDNDGIPDDVDPDDDNDGIPDDQEPDGACVDGGNCTDGEECTEDLCRNGICINNDVNCCNVWISGPLEACAGENVSFSAISLNAGGHYNWSGGNPGPNPTNENTFTTTFVGTGTYAVSVVKECLNGDKATDSWFVNVTDGLGNIIDSNIVIPPIHGYSLDSFAVSVSDFTVKSGLFTAKLDHVCCPGNGDTGIRARATGTVAFSISKLALNVPFLSLATDELCSCVKLLFPQMPCRVVAFPLTLSSTLDAFSIDVEWDGCNDTLIWHDARGFGEVSIAMEFSVEAEEAGIVSKTGIIASYKLSVELSLQSGSPDIRINNNHFSMDPDFDFKPPNGPPMQIRCAQGVAKIAGAMALQSVISLGPKFSMAITEAFRQAPGIARLLLPAFNSTFSISLAGQTTQVEGEGTFLLGNIPILDRFGSTGQDTPPDSMSDQFVRLTGISTVDGVTRYAESDCFQIRQNQVFVIRRLRISQTPPLTLEQIRVAAAASVLNEAGQQTRILLDGTLSDQVPVNLSETNECVTYQTSNSRIATINRSGILTARGPGLCFVTAIVDGIASVTRVLVAPGAGLTSVTGTVQLEEGTVVSGAEVSVLNQPVAGRTGLDGSFEIEGVAASLEDFPTLTAVARFRTGNRLYVGASQPSASVPSGITHVGLVTLSFAGDDRDGDGIPDPTEGFLRLSPDREDSDNDGLLDGEEDYDGDGITNSEEIALGTALLGRSGINILGERVPVGAATAAAAVFLVNPEPIEAFALVVEHLSLPVVRFEQGAGLREVEPEFESRVELEPGRSLLAAIIDLNPPHEFRTLDVRLPTEVFRVVFDISGKQGTTPVRVVREPFGPRGIVPEFTVKGRAVAPRDTADGEIIVSGE